MRFEAHGAPRGPDPPFVEGLRPVWWRNHRGLYVGPDRWGTTRTDSGGPHLGRVPAGPHACRSATVRHPRSHTDPGRSHDDHHRRPRHLVRPHRPPPQDLARRPGRRARAPGHRAGHGRVDTRTLGGWVADAARQDPAAASAAHAAIEDHLLKGSPGDVARFNEDVAAARLAPALRPRRRRPGPRAQRHQGAGRQSHPDETLGGHAAARGRARAASRPSSSGSWRRGGIEMNHRPYAAPAGSLGKTSGAPLAKANNTNGTLARDAIAAREAGPAELAGGHRADAREVRTPRRHRGGPARARIRACRSVSRSNRRPDEPARTGR